jgi:hypothetical protein
MRTWRDDSQSGVVAELTRLRYSTAKIIRSVDIPWWVKVGTTVRAVEAVTERQQRPPWEAAGQAG